MQNSKKLESKAARQLLSNVLLCPGLEQVQHTTSHARFALWRAFLSFVSLQPTSSVRFIMWQQMQNGQFQQCGDRYVIISQSGIW